MLFYFPYFFPFVCAVERNRQELPSVCVCLGGGGGEEEAQREWSLNDGRLSVWDCMFCPLALKNS